MLRLSSVLLTRWPNSGTAMGKEIVEGSSRIPPSPTISASTFSPMLSLEPTSRTGDLQKWPAAHWARVWVCHDYTVIMAATHDDILASWATTQRLLLRWHLFAPRKWPILAEGPTAKWTYCLASWSVGGYARLFYQRTFLVFQVETSLSLPFSPLVSASISWHLNNR